MSSGATSVPRTARRRVSPRIAVRRAALGVGVVVVLAFGAASLFAGSPTRLAEGTTVGGLDVGGLSVTQATAALERRSAALERRPLPFTAGGETFLLTASQLGVRPDWRDAVARAADASDGLGPVRGLRRLQTRVFGVDVEPHVTAYPSALRAAVARIAGAVERPAVSASVRRRGLQLTIDPGRAGLRLDRGAAGGAIVAALAALNRTRTALPLVRAEQKATEPQLAEALVAARAAISAPVTLAVGKTRFRLERRQVAELLRLPAGGETRVAVAGQKVDTWLSRLAETVNRAPRDATFEVVPGGIQIVPARAGLALELEASRRAIERAVFSESSRRATLAVATAEPDRTTSEAKAMGITGIVGSYTTTYGGTPGRLHNVQLVAELIDGALVAPGERFSFNETTGERNADRGFQEAPVIINGELQDGIGGGVCQVSTTVFNAAFEAGLSIEKRTNHALYISHYPLGRDATVNYPDVDLVFRNDTDRWLLVRAFVGTGSLTVNLYGAPQGRRIETETAPLEVVGKVPWKRVDDDTMLKGTKVVEAFGAPPRKTSVTRRVYAPDGTLMYDTSWSSYYVGEPTVVRMGAKPRPKVEPKLEPPATAPGGPSQDAPATTPELPRASATSSRP